MSKKPQETAAAALIPLFIIVLTPKGGVGKSLLAALIAHFLSNLSRKLRAVSIDSRHPTRRLLERIGVLVEIADLPTGEALRKDPHAVLRAFAPVQTALSQGAGSSDILVDVGSPAARPFLSYAIHSDLRERVKEAGYRTVVVVPVTAQPESIALGADTVMYAKQIFEDDGTVIVVANERDGVLPDMSDVSMARLLDQADATFVMPTLPPHWRKIDAASVLPGELPEMSLEEIAKIVGESDDMVRVVRSELRTWSRAMNEALRQALPGINPDKP